MRVDADGSCILTSTGKSPTLWRERGGPWCAVPNGESLRLTAGDEISLDCNDPDGAVFTCQDDSAVQHGGHDQYGSHDQYGAYSQHGAYEVPPYGGQHYDGYDRLQGDFGGPQDYGGQPMYGGQPGYGGY